MALDNKYIFYKKNDQYFEWNGLKDGLTLAFENTATVVGTLKDSSGTAVAGFTTITFNYVAASSGLYRGQIEETFDPPLGGGYTLHMDATVGTKKGHWEKPVEIKTRTQ